MSNLAVGFRVLAYVPHYTLSLKFILKKFSLQVGSRVWKGFAWLCVAEHILKFDTLTHTHTHVKGVDSEDVQAHLCGLTQGWEAESAWAALV